MTDDAIRAVEAMGDEVEDEGETQLLEEFNTAADALPGHLDSLGDADKLRFYGLFKQATVGKVNGRIDWLASRAPTVKRKSQKIRGAIIGSALQIAFSLM